MRVLIIDGLWHCLCPTFRSQSPFQLSQSLRLCRKTQSRHSFKGKRGPLSRQLFSSTTSQLEDQQQHPVRFGGNNLSRITRPPPANSSQDDRAQLSGRATEELHDHLQAFAGKGDHILISRIANLLVKERRQKPNLRIYAAMILANVDADNGSAAAVARLLEEMSQQGVGIDSGTYHAILRVLAVHPDYILRNEILEQMRQRWFTLTVAGWHDVVAGLIREKQFEIAYDKLEHMQRQGLRINSWLYDMFIYGLCDMGEIDEALKILEYRISRGDFMISATVWYQLLDTASRSFHHEATRYVWRKRVETEYLNPPSGVCFQVLSTASRHGDTALATDVFRILANRATVFTVSHYEALIEAYIAGDDLKTSLTILCIMKSAGVEPADASTRPIYLYLKSGLATTEEAFNILVSLNHGGKTVPTAAVNCLIQVSVHLKNLPQAVEHYKALHTVCSSGPNTATFNSLLRGCRNSGKKEQAMFLASEMLALKEDYEDAFKYLEEMKAQGFQPRQGTYLALVKKCTERQDERAWGLRQEMEEVGLETVNAESWTRDHWKESQ